MPDEPQDAEERAPGGLRGILGRVREVTYGMAAHDMTRYAMRTRASMEHLFILTTMGDLLGVPILPPYGCCPTSCPRFRRGSAGCSVRRTSRTQCSRPP